jgi:hypothetical protein
MLSKGGRWQIAPYKLSSSLDDSFVIGSVGLYCDGDASGACISTTGITRDTN